MLAFQSFFLGGFECSTHRLRIGKRLDLVHSTRHDQFVASDFKLLQRHGIFSAREGLRWHLIEAQPNHFDFSSAPIILAVAGETGMKLIWEVGDYGWPELIESCTPDCRTHFIAFRRAAE